MTATATATRKPKIRKTMCIAQPQLHDRDMKLPNFMRPLYGVGEHSTNFFLFVNLDTVLSFSTFWKSELLLLLKQYRNIFKITYENGRSISIYLPTLTPQACVSHRGLKTSISRLRASFSRLIEKCELLPSCLTQFPKYVNSDPCKERKPCVK